MGGDTPLSGFSFDIAVRIFPNSGIVWEIIANTANWISNKFIGNDIWRAVWCRAPNLIVAGKKTVF